MKRLPLASGRVRYVVRRPDWPMMYCPAWIQRVALELAWVAVQSISGAGIIVLLLSYLGLL